MASADSHQTDRDIEGLRQRLAELEAAEQLQRHASDELRRRVEERTADLRSTEAQLQGSEARFRNVFEYSNDSILLIDPDHDAILDVNARGCRLLGYTRQELQGLPISAVFPGDMARLQACALAVVEDGCGWIDEIDCQTRTGDRLAAEVSASEVPLTPERGCILVLMRDITKRKAAEAEIKASLQEKDVLLREVHHRVKNNLQVVTSLFDLQAKRSTDPDAQAMLRECRNRVRSMSAIHEALYRGEDLSRVDFRRYAAALVEELLRSYGAARRIELHLDMEDVYLDIDQAVPCGLIVNELASNALKYAFPGERQGRLRLAVAGDGGGLVLTIADDGVGLPEGLDISDSPSLGLRLVDSLVKQLRGQLDVDREAGTAFTVTFPHGEPGGPPA